MILKWLTRAEQDLNRQIDYITERNPAAALEALIAVRSATLRLKAFAQSGRIGRRTGTRELVVTGTPFVLIYKVEHSTVKILRLVHGAQQWPPRKKSKH
jgi:toxin ParE1/3/4